MADEKQKLAAAGGSAGIAPEAMAADIAKARAWAKAAQQKLAAEAMKGGWRPLAPLVDDAGTSRRAGGIASQLDGLTLDHRELSRTVRARELDDSAKPGCGGCGGTETARPRRYRESSFDGDLARTKAPSEPVVSRPKRDGYPRSSSQVVVTRPAIEAALRNGKTSLDLAHGSPTLTQPISLSPYWPDSAMGERGAPDMGITPHCSQRRDFDLVEQELLWHVWWDAEHAARCPPADGNDVNWSAIAPLDDTPEWRGEELRRWLRNRGAALSACSGDDVPLPRRGDFCRDPVQGVNLFIRTDPVDWSALRPDGTSVEEAFYAQPYWVLRVNESIDYYVNSGRRQPSGFAGPRREERPDLTEAAGRLRADMSRWELIEHDTFIIPEGAVGRWMWSVGMAFVPFHNYSPGIGTWPVGGYRKPPAYAFAPVAVGGCRRFFMDTAGTGGGRVEGGPAIPDSDGSFPAILQPEQHPTCLDRAGFCPPGLEFQTFATCGADAIEFATEQTLMDSVVNSARMNDQLAIEWNRAWLRYYTAKLRMECPLVAECFEGSAMAVGMETGREEEWVTGGGEHPRAFFLGLNYRSVPFADVEHFFVACVPA